MRDEVPSMSYNVRERAASTIIPTTDGCVKKQRCRTLALQMVLHEQTLLISLQYCNRSQIQIHRKGHTPLQRFRRPHEGEHPSRYTSTTNNLSSSKDALCTTACL